MNKIKKIFLCILFAAICVVLCGCVQLQADFGIDNSYEAFIKYDILVETGALSQAEYDSADRALKKIVDHYEDELGFVTSVEYLDSGDIKASFSYTTQNDSYEQAFESLASMLQDPRYTPFSKVDMSFEDTGFDQCYVFNATVDIHEIINYAEIDSIPDSMQESVFNGLENSNILFTVTLPSSKVINASDEIISADSLTTLYAKINHDKSTTIELETRLSSVDGKPSGLSTHVKATIFNALEILTLIFGVFGILFAGFCIYKLTKKPKPVNAEVSQIQSLPDAPQPAFVPAPADQILPLYTAAVPTESVSYPAAPEDVTEYSEPVAAPSETSSDQPDNLSAPKDV